MFREGLDVSRSQLSQAPGLQVKFVPLTCKVFITSDPLKKDHRMSFLSHESLGSTYACAALRVLLGPCLRGWETWKGGTSEAVCLGTQGKEAGLCHILSCQST